MDKWMLAARSRKASGWCDSGTRVLRGALMFCCLSLGLQGLPVSAQTLDNGVSEQLVTMDFQDVDLRQVARFVSELTNKNFVMDEKVKGKVTILTPRGISVDEAFQVFEAMLSVHGYVIVESGAGYKIMPTTKGRMDAVGLRVGKDSPPGLDAVTTQLIRLVFLDSNALATSLKALLHPWGALVPHVPSNSLIVVDSASTVAKVVRIARELDVPKRGAVLRVFPLDHAKASQVEKLLNSVYADFNARQPKAFPGVKAFADARTNKVLVSASADRLAEIEALIVDMDIKKNVGKGNVHLYYPKNGKAEIIAKVLNDLLGKVKGGDEVGQSLSFIRQVSVVGEETTNTLVVTATAEDYEKILPVIEGLDLRRLQVHVQALILEVNEDRAKDFGVEWRATEDFTTSNTTQGFGGTDFGNISNPLELQGLNVGVVKGSITVGGVAFPNLGLLVHALKSDTDVNILATPNILTLDNEQAEIVVGQNVPFRTGSQSTSGGSTLQSIERKDVGLKLQVTPQVLEGGSVLLKIFQEDSSLVRSNDPLISDVITNKRSIQTSVMLKSGETFVLGGLLRDNATEQVSMVPCLGSVWGAGELFKNTTRSQEKTNLMVFVSPIIVNTYEDLLKVTREKYGIMKRLRETRSDKGSKLVPRLELSPLPAGLVPGTGNAPPKAANE